MRVLDKNEVSEVSGGLFGLLGLLFCKPRVTHCPPPAPRHPRRGC